MNYTGKKVLVIGTGLSGIGAAQLLSREGAFVTLLDQNEKAQTEEICGRFAGTLTPEEMSRICIVIGDLPGENNTDNESPFGYEHFDQIVPSPAVPLDSPLLQKFEEEGTPIISEIELGSLFEKGKIIAITGTNGKTTTTTLVGEIMKAAAEKGLCSRIELRWDDARRQLSVGKRVGSFEGMPRRLSFRVVLPDGKQQLIDYRGKRKTVKF